MENKKDKPRFTIALGLGVLGLVSGCVPVAMSAIWPMILVLEIVYAVGRIFISWTEENKKDNEN